MTGQPRIHILAPVHNRRATTEKFINSLLAQTYPHWNLVLIDDGSKDGTAEMARARVPSLTLLKGTGDWWWAGSLHRGYLWLKRHADAGDYVLTMNDDTEFDPDFLASAVKAIKPRSVMLAQLRDMQGAFVEAGVRWDWQKLLCHPVTHGDDFNCFATRGLFLHLEDFLALGGFHPKLLPHYLSDYEFSIRAQRSGLALITSPDFHLRFDDNAALTGIRSTVGHSVFKRLKMDLSIRSTGNPVYWTSFVLLASPKRHLAANLFRVWWRFFSPVRDEVRSFFAPVNEFFAPARHFLGRVKRKIKREWAARTGVTR